MQHFQRRAVNSSNEMLTHYQNDGSVGCNGSDWRQIAAATAQYCRVDDGGTFGGVGDQAAWLFGCF
eukprot:scaffold118661_cov42-Cyclotella_meneghiniana.AAC.3